MDYLESSETVNVDTLRAVQIQCPEGKRDR